MKQRRKSVEEVRKMFRNSQPISVNQSIKGPLSSHMSKLMRNSDKTYQVSSELLPPSSIVQSLDKFQDFNIKEAGDSAKKTYIRVPQKATVIYDCIKDEQKVVKPPDLLVGVYSGYKER